MERSLTDEEINDLQVFCILLFVTFWLEILFDSIIDSFFFINFCNGNLDLNNLWHSSCCIVDAVLDMKFCEIP